MKLKLLKRILIRSMFHKFLVDNQTYLNNFHNDLTNLGFEQIFVVNFNKYSQDFVDDFHVVSIYFFRTASDYSLIKI